VRVKNVVWLAKEPFWASERVSRDDGGVKRARCGAARSCVRHACTAFQLSSMARFRIGSAKKLVLALLLSRTSLPALLFPPKPFAPAPAPLLLAPPAAPSAAAAGVGSTTANQAAKPARNSSSVAAGSPMPRLRHKSCKSRRLKASRLAAPPHSNCHEVEVLVPDTHRHTNVDDKRLHEKKRQRAKKKGSAPLLERSLSLFNFAKDSRALRLLSRVREAGL